MAEQRVVTPAETTVGDLPTVHLAVTTVVAVSFDQAYDLAFAELEGYFGDRKFAIQGSKSTLRDDGLAEVQFVAVM